MYTCVCMCIYIYIYVPSTPGKIHVWFMFTCCVFVLFYYDMYRFVHV